MARFAYQAAPPTYPIASPVCTALFWMIYARLPLLLFTSCNRFLDDGHQRWVRPCYFHVYIHTMYRLAFLGLWGIGVGAAVSLFMSDVPVFKQDVLLKIPFVRFQAPFSLSLWRICLVVHYNNNARVFLSIGQTILY